MTLKMTYLLDIPPQSKASPSQVKMVSKIGAVGKYIVKLRISH